ncbi:hypothetical protein A6770_11525 [Nostoc minutum NIES-26]|uniref:Uncharacterized protein n=1 Tax=Nostoc minutum NIES-26 TaxID=1844469 RepID=A0A367RT35_9NOSO|nr:hypothetical protein [Dendronalium sp. ChiSLP03b]MDZ8206950.1 hypothetical protein [Dendronalium sp. ChiSLP03b]RCJ39708.1 hypothetical protein A6770_11525 [Nostoc minutum NIES-26]
MPKTNDILNEDEIASLGASLRAIEQKLLKQGQKDSKTRIWFQGEEPYFDVFFELNNDEILWFQFTLRGKSITWDKRKPELQTGNTNELCLDDVSFYAASKTIENDRQQDWEFIYLVKSILRSRSEEPIFAKALTLFN